MTIYLSIYLFICSLLCTWLPTQPLNTYMQPLTYSCLLSLSCRYLHPLRNVTPDNRRDMIVIASHMTNDIVNVQIAIMLAPFTIVHCLFWLWMTVVIHFTAKILYSKPFSVPTQLPVTSCVGRLQQVAVCMITRISLKMPMGWQTQKITIQLRVQDNSWPLAIFIFCPIFYDGHPIRSTTAPNCTQGQLHLFFWDK